MTIEQITNPITQAPEEELPLVSILLPVRNEAGFIGGCIESIAAQDYPRDRYEVILIDGESTDATLDEAQIAAYKGGLSVTYLNNSRHTTATALNMGITASRGNVIVRVDGHTRLAPDFVSANVRALRQSKADATGGPITTVGRGVIGRAIALALSSPFGIGDASFRLADAGEQWTDSVPFAAYRREVFDEVGMFSEDIDRGEDDEFNYRLRDAGGGILLSPTIRSEYYCRESLGGLARQYWGFGLAKAAVLQRHPQRLRPRHMVPSALVGTLAGGIVMTLVNRRFAWIPTLAGGLYTGAAILVSRRIAARGHSEEAPYLPAVFACIHFSAGAGLIAGYVRRLFKTNREQP